MNSLQAENSNQYQICYRLYAGDNHYKNPFKQISNDNEYNHLIRKLSCIVWRLLCYHFYHDLSFFVAYFSLIRQKKFCRRFCRFLQCCCLCFAAYFTGIWLASPLLPRWARLIGVDIFYLLGLNSNNYLWILALLGICHQCVDLLLIKNTGSTSVMLYRVLVGQNSNDFVFPLVSSLATTGNAHFRKYLANFDKRKKWWQNQRRARLWETTWAQYLQTVAVRLRSGLQMFPLLIYFYLINILLLFISELLKLSTSGVEFIFWCSLFLGNGLSMYLFAFLLYEVLAQLATLGLVLGIAYYVFLEQISSLIGLQNLRRKLPKNFRSETRVLSERTFFVFRLYTARCIDYIGDFNQVYGQALAFYYLFCYPCNAAIVVSIVFRPIDWLYVASAGMLSFYQLLLMFGVHVYSAKMTAKLHKPARWLIGTEVVASKKMEADILKGPNLKIAKRSWDHFRVRLQLANYIAHFHTTYQYAITYGKAGNITFRSFTRVSAVSYELKKSSIDL